ncbi:MAG: helix-turn-helix transcriptional regulator [Oscillospiraceae bacterium]|nr:helix-turn-helix transcriptional regulator [Oscillospiraceae bacterium]
MLCFRIRDYIEKSGLKFGAVADRVGIPPNVFSAMMTGKRKISAEEYFAICKALGVPLEQFAA